MVSKVGHPKIRHPESLVTFEIIVVILSPGKGLWIVYLFIWRGFTLAKIITIPEGKQQEKVSKQGHSHKHHSLFLKLNGQGAIS